MPLQKHSQYMMKQTKKTTPGFTLIELLLVIGIIAVLATVVIVALDPAKRFADARNARRISDTQSILTAIRQYVVDNNGTLPPGLDTTEKQIGNAVDSYTFEITYGGCGVTGYSDSINFESSLAKYLKQIPFDPVAGADLGHSHYTVVADDNGIVTVRACEAEGEESILISR